MCDDTTGNEPSCESQLDDVEDLEFQIDEVVDLIAFFLTIG